MLTAQEKERYNRQIIIENIGESGQDKLKQARVLLAGAGGLGSPLAIFLAAAGIGSLRIVDSGRVELSNLNRQILYQEEDIGQLKVECARKVLTRLNPNVQIEAIAETIQDSNVSDLVSQCSIVVDALDNYATRHLLNQAVFPKGIPLVHGAVEEFFGQVTLIRPGKTNCLKCLFPQGPAQQAWPIISVTCGIVASFQAAEVVKYLLGTGSLLENRLLIIDGLSGKVEEIAIEKNPNCEICGAILR
jgi:adenylyltransferase/sulfurtransferase